MDHITSLTTIDHGIYTIATFIDFLLKYKCLTLVTTSISTDQSAYLFLASMVSWQGVPE